jgi:hypothetical protein
LKNFLTYFFGGDRLWIKVIVTIIFQNAGLLREVLLGWKNASGFGKTVKLSFIPACKCLFLLSSPYYLKDTKQAL